MDKKTALENLQKRKDNKPEQINNATLYAGSPMYFYCQMCGHLSDVKPESYTTPVKKLCDECEEIKKEGWVE